MLKKSKHINSLKNLEKGVSIQNVPGAIQKGLDARRKNKKLKNLLNEITTEEDWKGMLEAWIREAKKNPQFANIIIGIKENFKNREIKAKEKSNEIGQTIADHLKGLEVTKTIELPETDYEETGRTPE